MDVNDEIEKIYVDTVDLENQWGEKYKEDLAIDINNLHTEGQVNAELLFKYHKLCARGAKIVAALDIQKKTVRSKLVKEVTITPTLFEKNKKKVTGLEAECYYRMHPDYIAVVEALAEAEHQYNLFEGMKLAFQDRKWTMKDLTSLALSDYFESKESKKTRKVYTQDEAVSLVNNKDILNDSMDEFVQGENSQKEELTEKEKNYTEFTCVNCDYEGKFPSAGYPICPECRKNAEIFEEVAEKVTERTEKPKRERSKKTETSTRRRGRR